jgi:membrane-bound lytic murein transglycosylase F
MRGVLPLLAQKQYYKTLKHGYARGSEPVLYVSRIRNYEDILKRAVD